MHGHGSVSWTNDIPVSNMLALGQSPLQMDQYRSSIKSLVLLYSDGLNMILQSTQQLPLQLRNQQELKNQLKTALCNIYGFCNTELKTATVTKIKGLSIQTQLNTFVLFTSLNYLLMNPNKELVYPLTTFPNASGTQGSRHK